MSAHAQACHFRPTASLLREYKGERLTSKLIPEFVAQLQEVNVFHQRFTLHVQSESPFFFVVLGSSFLVVVLFCGFVCLFLLICSVTRRFIQT